MKNLIKQLYKSEINLSFSWFWDSGFDVKIGDDSNGFAAEFSSHDIDECIKWIEDKVKELYPQSTFAQEYAGETFESASEAMMKYLSENQHPHTMAVIENNKAFLWEGKKTYANDKYVVD